MEVGHEEFVVYDEPHHGERDRSRSRDRFDTTALYSKFHQPLTEELYALLSDSFRVPIVNRAPLNRNAKLEASGKTINYDKSNFGNAESAGCKSCSGMAEVEEVYGWKTVSRKRT